MNKQDWRIRNQEEYLTDAILVRKQFKSSIPLQLRPGDDPRNYNDHEHCDFCGHKFMEDCVGIKDCSSVGYCTLDKQIWVCNTCFDDFKNDFHWKIAVE